MPRILSAIFIIAVLTTGIYAQSVCAKRDPKTHKLKCCGAKSYATCPANGCGADVLLSAAKNRTDHPNAADVQPRTIIQIANFTHPAAWKPNTPRARLVTWGEGTPLQVSLYLQKVKNYPGGYEACNCNLKLDRNNDYHLVLGSKPKSAERQSLTAEITPRIRPDKWDYKRLTALAKQRAYVRVTGWAMLDTQHVGKTVPVRKTHWEIHPVTKFEVCTTTKTGCDAGTGWTPLEQMP